MKIKVYKIGSLTTCLLFFIGGGIMFSLPVFIIQAAWNSSIGLNQDYLNLSFFQSAILWLMFLVLLYISGIFKVKVKVDNIETNDIENEIEKITKETTKKD